MVQCKTRESLMEQGVGTIAVVIGGGTNPSLVASLLIGSVS
jgi:hypothetical protein